MALVARTIVLTYRHITSTLDLDADVCGGLLLIIHDLWMALRYPISSRRLATTWHSQYDQRVSEEKWDNERQNLRTENRVEVENEQWEEVYHGDLRLVVGSVGSSFLDIRKRPVVQRRVLITNIEQDPEQLLIRPIAKRSLVIYIVDPSFDLTGRRTPLLVLLLTTS